MPEHLVIADAHPLVHVNATLNSVATVLLVVGLVLVKRGAEVAHQRTMQAALVVSAAFLACYLYYHSFAGHVKFTQQGVVRYVYYTILASHVLLAITVPFLALLAAYLGTRALGDAPGGELGLAMRRRHRSVVRWAYPIWLYVSVTGVLVYLMLYHLWPPEGL